MKPSLRTKLDSLVARRAELERLLAAEDATRDMDKFRKLSREHAELSPIVALYESYRQGGARRRGGARDGRRRGDEAPLPTRS